MLWAGLSEGARYRGGARYQGVWLMEWGCWEYHRGIRWQRKPGNEPWADDSWLSAPSLRLGKKSKNNLKGRLEVESAYLNQISICLRVIILRSVYRPSSSKNIVFPAKTCELIPSHFPRDQNPSNCMELCKWSLPACRSVPLIQESPYQLAREYDEHGILTLKTCLGLEWLYSCQLCVYCTRPRMVLQNLWFETCNYHPHSPHWEPRANLPECTEAPTYTTPTTIFQNRESRP